MTDRARVVHADARLAMRHARRPTGPSVAHSRAFGARGNRGSSSTAMEGRDMDGTHRLNELREALVHVQKVRAEGPKG